MTAYTAHTLNLKQDTEKRLNLQKQICVTYLLYQSHTSKLFPKSLTNRGPSFQTHEPKETILNQAILLGSCQ